MGAKNLSSIVFKSANSGGISGNCNSQCATYSNRIPNAYVHWSSGALRAHSFVVVIVEFPLGNAQIFQVWVTLACIQKEVRLFLSCPRLRMVVIYPVLVQVAICHRIHIQRTHSIVQPLYVTLGVKHTG